MKTHSNSDEIYLGKNAGKEILRDIKGAMKSVKIISPYSSPQYIDELVNLAERGFKVTLITSDDIKEGDGKHSNFNHKQIIMQKRHTNEKKEEIRNKGKKFSSFAFILNVIPLLLFFFMEFHFWILIVFLAGITLISLGGYFYFKEMRIYTYSYYTLFRLKVFHSGYRGKELVHSKVYVIDDKVAYVGSVNFTYYGMDNNYECAVKIKDKNAVQDLSKEIEKLYDSNLVSKNIQNWGRSLYPEPKN